MIRCNDEVDVERYVRLALDMGIEHALVEGLLSKVHDRVADAADDARNEDLIFLLLQLGARLVSEAFGLVHAGDGGEQLSNGLDLVERIRREDASARVLDGCLKLNEHEGIESEVRELVLDENVAERAV